MSLRNQEYLQLWLNTGQALDLSKMNLTFINKVEFISQILTLLMLSAINLYIIKIYRHTITLLKGKTTEVQYEVHKNMNFVQKYLQ